MNNKFILTFFIFQYFTITSAIVFGFKCVQFGVDNEILTFLMNIDPCPHRRDDQEEESVDV